MSPASQPIQITKKRLVICCDGTWMNSDTGYRKSSYRNPIGKTAVPSNVTRLSRSLRRSCTDGTLQVIDYHSGIGLSGSFADVLSGGAFGLSIFEVCLSQSTEAVRTCLQSFRISGQPTPSYVPTIPMVMRSSLWASHGEPLPQGQLRQWSRI